MIGVFGSVGSISSSAIADSAHAMSGSHGSNGADARLVPASRGVAVVGSSTGASTSIGPNIVDGSSTSTVVPGLPCDSVTVIPWREASSETTDMPSVGSTDRPTIGGSRKSSFSSTRRSPLTPTPSTIRSMYESPARRPPTRTTLSGGLNDVALSSSSASRCDTSATTLPAHLQVLERLDLDPAVVLDLADRGAHDVVDLGRLDPARLGSALASTSSDSLLRRMRVAMWSSW